MPWIKFKNSNQFRKTLLRFKTGSSLSKTHTHTHTHRGTHLCIPMVHLPSVNTAYLPQMLNDCLHFTACSLQGRLITHMIFEMKWLSTWSCFTSCCLERERERSRSTSVLHIGFLTTGGYYGYLFGVGGSCHSPTWEMNDDQSLDLWVK